MMTFRRQAISRFTKSTNAIGAAAFEGQISWFKTDISGGASLCSTEHVCTTDTAMKEPLDCQWGSLGNGVRKMIWLSIDMVRLGKVGQFIESCVVVTVQRNSVRIEHSLACGAGIEVGLVKYICDLVGYIWAFWCLCWGQVAFVRLLLRL